MAATNQTEAEAWEPPQLDEALQDWLFDESRTSLDLDYANNDAVGTSDLLVPPALTSNAAQILPRNQEQSPLISGSWDTSSPTNVLSGSCTTASSLVQDWPPLEEASLSELMTAGGCTGLEWPLSQPEPPSSGLASSQVTGYHPPVYQPELPDVSSTPAWHNSRASPGTSEPTSFNFNSAPSSILGSPPITTMLPSQCGSLMPPCCSRMEPLYHRTANGFEICQHPSIPIPDVPGKFLTNSCLSTRLHSSSADESSQERNHNPDVNSPPHSLSARERRKLTKPEKCPMTGCSKRYPYKRELGRHMRAKHKEAVPQTAKLPCPFPGCNKFYARDDHVTRHWKKKHGELGVG